MGGYMDGKLNAAPWRLDFLEEDGKDLWDGQSFEYFSERYQ
jgi:hypothetical protein